MTDEEKPSLYLCPQCGLPFKTEDILSIHTANWHSDEANTKRKKEVKPEDLLWPKLVRRIHETPEGFQGLSDAEKRYVAVNTLVGQVYNGGFDQYFFNSSGSYYEYTILVLEEMDAQAALALLQQAKRVVFDTKNVPENTGERRALFLEHNSDQRSKTLYELDKQFYQIGDDLIDKNTAYAKKHGLL